MALFYQLATLADELAATASRLKKRAAIAAAISAVQAVAKGEEPEESAQSDAGLFASFLAGMPFAEHDPRKLNAGGALLTRAVMEVSRASEGEMTAAYRRHGDLGAAAHDLLLAQPQPSATLSLTELGETFAAIASARTTAVRAALVEGMLRRATAIEAKYLIKLMLNDMRIGVKQSLIEEAIAVAAGAEVVEVRHAVMLEADLAHATERAFAGTLGEARMTLFHPLGFMLASPVESPEEAVARFSERVAKIVPVKTPKVRRPRGGKGKMEEGLGNEGGTGDGLQARPPGEPAAVVGASDGAVGHSDLEALQIGPAPQIHAFLEDKYDGMRAQLHCGDPAQPGRVAIYSRNREDITESFPELAEAFARVDAALHGPLILDGEILGWDLGADRALPFAVMGQRIGRKRVSNEMRQQVPVIFMAFDLLYAGELTLELPLRERRERLEAVAEAITPLAVSPLTQNPQAGPQGRMFAPEPSADPAIPRLRLSPSRLVESAEDIDRAYVDARARSNEGVMLKAAASLYQPGRRGLAWVKLKRELATLDVVITGAEFGHGRRAPFLSDYTFAVRASADSAELLNVGKAYSGVTDVEIVELTEFLQAHTLEDHGHFRTVEPLIVLEVAFNNIMRSTRHASGFALRFPRILRLRPDKPLGEIDTLARVEEIFQSQVDKPAEVEGEAE